MNQILSKWLHVEKTVDSLTVRERIIIFLTATLVIFMLWYAFLYSSLINEKDRLQADFSEINKSVKAAGNEEKVLISALRNDPNASKRIEIKGLEDNIQRLELDMVKMSTGLVLAEHFPKILSEMLHKEEGVEVVEFKMLPTEELLLSSGEGNEENRIVNVSELNEDEFNEDENTTLYKHAVSFKIKSDFFKTILYMKKLEDMKWKVYWEKLDYKVESYPEAIVQIKAYTISVNKGKFRGRQ